MFADVVGSTALGERLDPETVAELVGDVVATVILAVEANGGTVKDIAGDGVLALFEVPSDAGRAAVAVIEAVAALRTAAERHEDTLDVRVGAHIGAVRTSSVGQSSPGADALTRVVGPAIAEAVSLEGRAEPGTALVSTALLGQTAGSVTEPSDRAPRSAVLVAAADVKAPQPLPSRDERRVAATTSAVRGERRTVVALFGAVGVVDVGDVDDDATNDDVVADALSRGIEIIERFGGKVKDLAGDVIVALFGAPMAHEDDGERAVSAGLALCRELDRASNSRVGVQVGIASGRVVVGSVGAGHRIEYGAVGDAMNTAARLEAKCAMGSVLVTAETARPLADRFSWGPPVHIEAKGKRQPVEARVATMRPGSGRSVASPSVTADLVGRDLELVALRAAIEFHAVTVVIGDAGVGKTELVRSAVASLPERTWVVVGCPSWESDRHLGVAMALLDALGAPSDVHADPQASPAAVEADLRERLRAAMSPPGAEGRLGIFCDDQQWIDGASLRVVLGAVATCPEVALVSAVRTEGQTRIADAAEAGDISVQFVEVSPLEPPLDAALLDRLVGRAALPWDLERRLLAAAKGNPFFLDAQVAALRACGRLIDEGAGLHYLAGPDPELPESVERLMLTRLDGLESTERAVVDALAVLRDPVTRPVLSAVSGLDPARVAAGVEHLAAGGLIVSVDDRVGLANGLAQETAYTALLLRDRRRLHRASADALSETDPAALAWHRWGADQPSEAARWAVVAAEEAQRRLSHVEVAALFSLAARAAERAGASSTRCAELWLRAGHGNLAAASLDDAMDAFARAGSLSLAGRDGMKAARAAVGYEDAMFETRRLRATASEVGHGLLRGALDLGALLDPATRSRLLAALGRERRFSGAIAEAEEHTGAAVAEARRSGDASALAYALNAWRICREAPAFLHQRSSTDGELVAAAEKAGDPSAEFEARRSVLMDQLASGSLDRAWGQIDELTRLASALGERRLAWLPPMWRTMRHLAMGDLTSASASVDEVYEQGRRAAYNDVVAVHALQEYLIRRHQGRVDEAAASFLRAEQLAGLRWSVFRASFEIERDQRAAARVAMETVLSDLSLLGGDRILPTAIASLTDAVEALEEVDGARRLYERLLPWQGHLAVVGTGAALTGPVDTVLGRLAATAGARSRAVEHLRDGLAFAQRSQLRLSVAEGALGLASVVERDEGIRLRALARGIGEATGSFRLVTLADAAGDR